MSINLLWLIVGIFFAPGASYASTENTIHQPQCMDHLSKGILQMDQLVSIRSFIPQIQVELKYATADNFTGEVVYHFHECLLLKETALRLRDVQAELETMGLGLKIWDGFRPIAAQWKFWELVPDPRYVADPREGGRHTRGTAVDLTLVTKEGKELPMPSALTTSVKKLTRIIWVPPKKRSLIANCYER